MKGKYAARAANREAALDNDIIREKTNQIAALKNRIAELEATLTDQRRSHESTILARADTLSAKQIAEVTAEFDNYRHSAERDMRTVAERLTPHFRDGTIDGLGYLNEILPLLVPDEDERNEHAAVLLESEENHQSSLYNNRHARRQGFKQTKRGLTRLHSDDGLEGIETRREWNESGFA